MNVLKKNNIKSAFKYSWPLYVISAVIISLVLYFIFSIVHRIPVYQTLTIFITGEVIEENKFKDDLLAKFKEKELKQVTLINVDEEDPNYYTQLTINGYNSADILIIPENKLDSLATSAFALELDEELTATYVTYSQENTKYGIKLDKELVKNYMHLPTSDCYMLLNGKSENIGKYGGNSDHDNALTLIKEWGLHAI